MIVAETTTNVSIVLEEGEKSGEVDTSQSAADAADFDIAQDLDMSTHGLVDQTDHGDAYVPDQQDFLISGAGGGQPIADPDVSVDIADLSLFQVESPRDRVADENTSVKSVDENITLEPALRRSSRVRKKPPWQQSGDYCMSVTSKNSILQSLLSPSTLSQLHPDVIYAVVKGVSDTL